MPPRLGAATEDAAANRVGAFSNQEVADLADPSAQAFNRRSLFETTETAVNQFSLEETLDALGSNAGLAANGLTLYQELIDTYATAPAV